MANTDLQPALFIAHGSPANAFEDNDFSQTLKQWGEQLKPRPKAILCISAHWETDGLQVTSGHSPRTVHDFGGFPKEFYEFRYPAPGSSWLIQTIKELLDVDIFEQDQWGFDHGTWGVLKHLFPQADIPVVQLSLNKAFTTQQHYDCAKKLRTLREKGVLVIGSGNVVHSFKAMSHLLQSPPPSWAVEFNTRIREWLTKTDHQALINYRTLFPQLAALSVPTEDHFLPLFYVIGLQSLGEDVHFKYQGFQNASMSMMSFQIG
jgi:4,5-DOPA dioxygenase extradiol